MKKYFEYWTENKTVSFLWKYWVFYICIYVIAVYISILKHNPFVFFIIGLIPRPVLWMYKIIHDPTRDIEKSIAEYAPSFYRSFCDNVQTKKISNHTREASLLSELINHYEEGKEPVVSFIRNVRSINISGALSLIIWFFSFIIIVFTMYLNTKM